MGTPILQFRDEYRFLSNFFPYEMIVRMNGTSIAVPTLEHAYQMAKTHDHDAQRRIARAATAREAKQLGRAVTLREDWVRIQIPVMLKLLYLKFDGVLGPQLRATGSVYLQEGNTWHDRFWGHCTCGVCLPPQRNWLGVLLMHVRDTLPGQSV